MDTSHFSNKNNKRFVLYALVCIPLTCANLAKADNSEIESLKKEIQQERQRLNELERRLNLLLDTSSPADETTAAYTPIESDARPAATVSEVAVTSLAKAEVATQEINELAQPLAAEGRGQTFYDPNFPKSASLAGSPWRFSFGGYAKADLIYDLSGTGDEQQFLLSQIPVDNTPSDGSYSHMQVSETRFNFESRNMDPKYKNNRFFVEFDFFDQQNRTSTRLRHAYVEYGPLIAGRTWTLLSELRQLPLMIDFASGDSILGGRTEQIRWTTSNEAKTLGWAVAIESFNDSSIANPFSLPGKARSDYPRLTGGITKLWDRGVWSTGAAATQVRFDGGDGVGDESEWAYTVTTAGRLYLDADKKNWFGFGVGYQSGSINDVITFANAGVPNASINSEGNLDLAQGWNTQLGLHWNWNNNLSSNFSYAYAKITDVPELFDPSWIRVGSAFHANLIYKYDELMTFGLEFMHGERENVSGRDGDAQRLQFSTFYYF